MVRMHSSREMISVLRVRDLKHPFKECVFAADFGSWKELSVFFLLLLLYHHQPSASEFHYL